MSKKLFEHKMERSSASHAILETKSRKRKAAKIKAVLDELTDFSKSDVLDIGTGSGHMAHEFSKQAKKVSSIDIVDERKEKKGYDFKLAQDETLPYKDHSFDVVITNHVVEHTPQQAVHLREALRVLKPGGHLYIATPNKFWLTDPHYKLPFISWLPRPLSSKYLKVTQKADWDIYPLSTRGVKKHMTGTHVKNALPLLLKSDAAKTLDTWTFAVKVAKFLPSWLLNLTQYVSPTLIYVARKLED